MITSGAIEALELIGKSFLDPGDLVVVEAPTYLGAIQAFRSFEAKLAAVPLDEHGLEVDELERQLVSGLRPKLVYTIPDHQNPAGVSLATERRGPLVELARRYGFLIVEDVAYRELGFTDETLPSLWSLGPDVVVQAGTTSKTFCPGVRLGWAVGPAEISAQLVSAKQLTDQCAGALGQRLFEESLAPRLDRGAADAVARALPAQGRAPARRARALCPGRRALDAPPGRLLLLADASRRRRLRRPRRTRGRAGRRHRPRHALLPGRPRRRHRSALVQPGRRSADRRGRSRSSGRCCEGDALPVGRHDEGAAQARPGPETGLDGADDAGAGVPRPGLHRPEALARERAADLHPRGQAPLLPRRGRSRRSSTSAPARCSTSPPGCRTRRKRSRTRSTWTSSARRGRTGSTAPTPTCARSEARPRRTPRSRHGRVEGSRRGDRQGARERGRARRDLLQERGRGAGDGGGDRRRPRAGGRRHRPRAGARLRGALGRGARRDRLPRQQRRRRAPGQLRDPERRGLGGRLRREGLLADPLLPRGAAAHARGGRRAHRQHRRRLLALPRPHLLRDLGQPRRGQLVHEDARARGGEGQHPRQRGQHRLRDHAAVGEHPPAACPRRAARRVLRHVRAAGGAARALRRARRGLRASSRSCSATGRATSPARRSTSPAAWAATSRSAARHTWAA